MHSLLRLLSLVLCVELILGPLPTGSLFIQNSWAVISQEECGKGQYAGMEWAEKLGRCITSTEVAKVQNDVSSCLTKTITTEKGETKTVPKTKEEQQDCFKKNGENALNREKPQHNDEYLTEGSNPQNLWGKGGRSAAVIAVPLFLLTKTMIHRHSIDKKDRSQFRCRPASLVLMYSAAGVLAAGEVFTYFRHQSKLNSISEKWKDVTTTDSTANADKQKAQTTEGQSQAFGMLADNEDSIASTARTKMGFYIGTTGLFAAGAVMATIEGFELINAKSILKNPKSDQLSKDQARLKIQRLTCNTVDSSDPNPSTTNSSNADSGSCDDESCTNTQDLKKESLTECKGEEDCVNDQVANKVQEGECQGEDSCTNPQNASKDQTECKDEQNCTNTQTTNKTKQKSYHKKSNSSGGANKGTPTQQQLDANCRALGFLGYSQGRCYGRGGAFHSIKKQAIKNLASAKNGSDLANLLAEIDALEFENYSKLSYIDKFQEEALSSFEINKDIAQILLQNFSIRDAYSEDTDERFQTSYAEDNETNLPTSGSNSSNVSKDVTNSKPSLVNAPKSLDEGMGIIRKALRFVGMTRDKKKIDAIEREMSSKFSKFIYSPWTRVAINGLLGTWMGIMSKEMYDQAKIADARADALRKIQTGFKTTEGAIGCKEEDRTDPKKTTCYCYTADGKKNPARSNSKICSQEWANYAYVPPTDYTKTENAKVCVDQSFGLDASCSCKDRKGPDGKNTCMKTNNLDFKTGGFSPGLFKMINAGTGPANDLVNGNMSAGQLDAGAIGNNAAKIKQAADELLKKTDPKAAKEVEKMAPAMEKSLIASGNGLSMGGLASSSAPLPSNPQQAAAALDKEIKEKSGPVETTSSSTAASPGGDGVVEQIDPNAAGGTEEQAMAEVMQKDLDYGSNDINNSSQNNIFDVLSNRYQRSGMRRLFDEEGKTGPDKPAKSDITK